MPAWIASALALLARPAVRGGLAGVGIGGLLPDFGIPGVELFGDDEKKRRRRRRKALTASDRADIAFIEATLGKAAGRSFAMLVVSRTAA